MVVDNKISVVFHSLITDQRVMMNLWVSESDELAKFNLVHYIKVDRIGQEHDVIGFEDNSMVLIDGCSRNSGIEREIMFCYPDRTFTRTIHGTLPNYSCVKHNVLFQFSDGKF